MEKREDKILENNLRKRVYDLQDAGTYLRNTIKK